MKWLRARRARHKKKPAAQMVHSFVPRALERDAGVEVERIQLPSGEEMVIVRRPPKD